MTVLGYGLWARGFVRCPTLRFTVFGAYYLPPWGKNRKLGELRLRNKVLIRTGLGTMAVLVGSVVVAVILRNYLGVVIGTWHILADLYWLVCDDI